MTPTTAAIIGTNDDDPPLCWLGLFGEDVDSPTGGFSAFTALVYRLDFDRGSWKQNMVMSSLKFHIISVELAYRM